MCPYYKGANFSFLVFCLENFKLQTLHVIYRPGGYYYSIQHLFPLKLLLEKLQPTKILGSTYFLQIAI
jgi:hypothetical protein